MSGSNCCQWGRGGVAPKTEFQGAAAPWSVPVRSTGSVPPSPLGRGQGVGQLLVCFPKATKTTRFVVQNQQNPIHKNGEYIEIVLHSLQNQHLDVIIITVLLYGIR